MAPTHSQECYYTSFSSTRAMDEKCFKWIIFFRSRKIPTTQLSSLHQHKWIASELRQVTNLQTPLTEYKWFLLAKSYRKQSRTRVLSLLRAIAAALCSLSNAMGYAGEALGGDCRGVVSALKTPRNFGFFEEQLNHFFLFLPGGAGGGRVTLRERLLPMYIAG